MSEITNQLAALFRETEGLPPFRRGKSGQVEGWPDQALARLSETISTLAHSSTPELCEAIIEIENANRSKLPKGLLTLLARVASDAPAAPDLIKVANARKRGRTLREALLEGTQNASACDPKDRVEPGS